MSHAQVMTVTVWMTTLVLACAVAYLWVQWRANSARSLRWIVGALGAMCISWVLFSVKPFTVEHPNHGWVWVVAFLTLTFTPWCMFRFGMELWGRWRPVLLVGNAVLAANVVAQLLVHDRVALGYVHHPRSAVLVQMLQTVSIVWWTSAAALVLWLSGRGQPQLVRRRCRMLSLTVVVFWTTQTLQGLREYPFIFVSFLVFVGAISLVIIAAAPPRWLQDIWHGPVLRESLARLGAIPASADVAEASDLLLPAIVQAAAARGAVLRRVGTGEVLGEHHIEARQATPRRGGRAVEDPTIRVARAHIELELVGTPHDPFLAPSDIELVEGLAQLLDIAVERSEILDRERQARATLDASNNALRDANSELTRLDTLRGDFVAIASHELRTPITTITGFTSTLIEMWSSFDESQRLQFLGHVDEQARRLLVLTEDLLMLSSVEAGMPRRQDALVNVLDVVHEVLAENGIDSDGVLVDVPSDACVRVDPVHLHRMIANLILNATKYGRPPVTVAAQRESHILAIAVVDNGDGVPEEFRDRLFERFTQARSGSDAKGHGLGLFIVRRLAERYGGVASLKAGVGGGAHFVIELPVD